MEEKNILVRSPIGYVLNRFEKEVVLFLVFYLVSRCLSATLYFVRNQSLVWQETVLFEHKVIRKVLSLNKRKSSEVQEIVWQKVRKYEPNFQLHDVPWLFSSYIGMFFLTCSLFIK